MNFRNMMKESVLAMAGPENEAKVKRFASEMRRQIKARNLKETPCLTVRLYAALVCLVRVLRMERLLVSPDAPEDAYERWEKASEALQKAATEFENALDRLDKTVPDHAYAGETSTPPDITEPASGEECIVIESDPQRVDAKSILARAREELDLFGVLPRVLEAGVAA